MEEPKSGSVWRHHSGRLYTVLFLTNEGDGERAQKYPRTVVYIGENQKRWSGPLSDWHRRMTLVRDHENCADAQMTPEQIRDQALEAGYVKLCAAFEIEERRTTKETFIAAIAAYEAAMNQQPEKAPMDELVLAKRRDYLLSPNLWMVARRISAKGEWQCIYGTRYRDREILYFRPLPKPPEVK